MKQKSAYFTLKKLVIKITMEIEIRVATKIQ